VAKSVEKPWWYLTSPDSGEPESPFSGSSYRLSTVRPMMLASTLMRPRCAMPITISLAPWRAQRAITWSSSGIRLSPPSSEKRFWPTWRVCRNFSSVSASVSRFSSCFLRSADTPKRPRADSMRSCSQRLRATSVMCMYSAPTWPQYAVRRRCRMSASVVRSTPNSEPVSNSRARSASVRP
jgi:hypothetical protein